ncbi:MAG: hypothetical protein GVY31_13320 [Alphaproteobacteria bacterium]|jgi:hypothetical protein|nr:hypothetical protein [Alphaproteobacteria bacterium]
MLPAASNALAPLGSSLSDARSGKKRTSASLSLSSSLVMDFMKGVSLEMAVNFFATSRETLENIYRSYLPDAQREAVEIMDRTL